MKANQCYVKRCKNPRCNKPIYGWYTKPFCSSDCEDEFNHTIDGVEL